MSQTRLLVIVVGFIVALMGAALIAFYTGDLGTRKGDPPGYGLDPTETTPQPAQP